MLELFIYEVMHVVLKINTSISASKEEKDNILGNGVY